MQIQVDPVADIFPPMTTEQYAALKNDIALCGLREPAWLWQGRIIDGRHRARACEELGIELRTQEYTGDDPIKFVVSLNLHRRHLDESQRAMVAANIANLEDGQKKKGASFEAASQEDAAYLLNVSRSSVQRAARVKNEGAPELVAAVHSGVVSVSAASQAVELDADTQRAIVQQVQAGRPAAEVIREYKPHVAHNSGNNEWYTPADIIEAARQAMGGIDCDPASCELANVTVKASVYYTAEQDGLTQQWNGSVWMNPPYAQPHCADFCAKLVEEVDSQRVQQACVLVNNATETQWFQMLLSYADAVCFPRGRVRFIDADGKQTGAPLQGQAILYLGDNVSAFIAAFNSFGPLLFSDE